MGESSTLLQGYEGPAYSKFNPGLDKIPNDGQKIARDVHDMKCWKSSI